MTLDQCLGLAELTTGKVLVPGRWAAQVKWAAVIEWPVENFVSEGDFVLTTGAGRTTSQLLEMIEQIADSGAAAVGLATGPGALHIEVPQEVIAFADNAGIALLALPWDVRFSDVSQAIIKLIYGTKALPVKSGLSLEFSNALLGPHGISGVASTLEALIEVPVVVFDAALNQAGAGELGRRWLSEEGREAGIVAAVAELLAKDGAEVGLGGNVVPAAGGATVYPARIHDGIAGWLIIGVGQYEDNEAIGQAVTAASIELLRKLAYAEAESQGRESFFWDLASGFVTNQAEIRTRAALVGLSPSIHYRVALCLFETNAATYMGLSARMTARMLQRRLTHPGSVVALREHEMLICRHEMESVSLEALLATLPSNAGVITCGQADGSHSMTSFRRAASQARTTLTVARALYGKGEIGYAERLGPYLLVAQLLDNEETLSQVAEVLSPLESADETKGSELIRTLEGYLEASGNISQAARALFLNRHTLIYRLGRIRDLTGKDLESRDNRFLLDVALRIRRLRQCDPGQPIDLSQTTF